MKNHLLRVFFLLNMLFVFEKADSSPNKPEVIKHKVLVHTNVGGIEGMKALDGNYTQFTGIPYAKVDENYPFGLSTPYLYFNNVFDATKDSAMCPQMQLNGNIVGTLDCLQLNIYVPDDANTKNLVPVMVWIHGGAFDFGAANRQFFGPKFLVQHGIILVTINYRIGLYGFLCLNIPEVPGNQGLRDQLLALIWIRDNIIYFGGDKEKITLFGQGVGAMSIHMHMLSLFEDLYNNVILQSASAFTPDAIMAPDDTIPVKIAEKLGLRTELLEEALTYISNRNIYSVIKTVSDIPGLNFGPCIPGNEYTEKYIPDYPANSDIIKIKRKPAMFGFNSNEAIIFFADVPPQEFERNNLFAEYILRYFNFSTVQRDNVENIVTKFYLGGKSISQETKPEVSNFMSDFMFNYPVERCVDSFLRNHASKLFYYVLSYVGNRSLFKETQKISSKGAVHGDELPFLFDIEALQNEITLEDKITIDRMTTMWTNFAKFGDPTPYTDTLLPIKWTPISKYSGRYYLDINSEMKMGTVPFHERMAFWDLFYDAYKYAQKGYVYRNQARKYVFCSKMLLTLSIVFVVK